MQNSDTERRKPKLPKIACKLVILAFCLETISYVFLYMVPFWYEDACREIKHNSIPFIFIGSSHVAIAVNTKEFARSVGADGSRRVPALNLGRGYSTLAEHYWGLKKLAATRAGALKGTVVFLEAPMGMPDLSTWSESWFAAENPELLVNAMALRDLIPFWVRSNADRTTKLEITCRKISRCVQVFGNGISLLSNVKKHLEKMGLIPETQTELAAIGGILTDNASIINARKSALLNAEYDLAHQHLFTRDEEKDLVLVAINDLVSANGGRLVLYTMPLCSIQQRPFATEVAKRNQATVHKMLADLKIPLLEPVIKTNDEDFPDYYHLRNSRAPEFSRKLARAYLELPKADGGTK